MKSKHLPLFGAAVCSLFVAVNPAFAQGLAFTTNTLSVGFAPICVVAADVNGDGKLDLVCANFGFADGNTLTVLTNNGSGLFGSNATLTVGNGVGSVMAADVNDDGEMDLICANSGDNTLTILTNNGSGLFGSNATLPAGSNPAFVVAADVNGDGKLDLICADFGSYGTCGNTLTVLTNSGNGVFGFNATLEVGNNPDCVTAADINGDGKLDLISANFYDGTLTVLTNNGNGMFGSNATLEVGSNSRRVVTADINGDGKPDLISANLLSDTLTMLTNNGSGVFGLNATLEVGSGGAADVVAADMNGDGKLDLISANSGYPYNTLTVLTNNGSGVLGYNTTLTVSSEPSQPYCVVAADVNSDGKLDLISANFYNSTLTVLMQTIVVTPRLIITSAGPNAIVLSWSSFSTGFTLQTNSDLTTANWMPAGYTISTANGTNQSITVTPPPGNLFFRLKQ